MLVNGDCVPSETIEEEFRKLKAVHAAHGTGAPATPDDEALGLMAACAVVDRVLIRQHAEKDLRRIDPSAIEREMREQMAWPPRASQVVQEKRI
jgi:hypothetical protein